MIELKHVSKTFYKKHIAVHALTDISLQIAEGEIFVSSARRRAGLIKLKDGVGLLPTINDIVSNTKNLKILELEAPQSYQSPEVAEAAEIAFKGGAVKGW